MKKALFYTFLMQFVIVFAITVLGILQVVTVDKAYLDKLFYLLIVESAGSVIGLYRQTKFFPESNGQSAPQEVPSPRAAAEPSSRQVTILPAPARTEQATPSAAPHESKAEPSFPDDSARFSTAEAYFRANDDLRDRFGELAEFWKRSHGKVVTWRGRVERVSAMTDRVWMSLSPAPPDLQRSFHAGFPQNMRERLFGLHMGDMVDVTGTISENNAYSPILDAQEFRLVAKASGPNAGS